MKASGKREDIWKSVLTGTVAFILINMIIVGIGAWLILKGSVPETAVRYICVISITVGMLSGGFLAVGGGGDRRMIPLAVTALVCFGVLASLNAVFFEGVYSGVWETLLCLSGSSACVALMRPQKRKRKFRIKR